MALDHKKLKIIVNPLSCYFLFDFGLKYNIFLEFITPLRSIQTLEMLIVFLFLYTIKQRKSFFAYWPVNFYSTLNVCKTFSIVHTFDKL